jgi:hypothetical protein
LPGLDDESIMTVSPHAMVYHREYGDRAICSSLGRRAISAYI